MLRLYAALFFCLSSLYAFRYDGSLQTKRDGVEFSELESPQILGQWLHVSVYGPQVAPEPMAAWSPPVKTPVMFKVFRSHTRPSPHPRPCPLSGTREEVSRCVSSDFEAWWSLTRGFDHGRDFLLREDAQRNSTHNL